MDKRILLTLALGITSQLLAHAWELKGDKIKTVWAEKVTPANVWQSYPRPQLQRAAWMNLNGLWKYAVTDKTVARKDVSFDGEILVPFAIESSLSGVQRSFLPSDKLWYQREFALDPSWKNKSILLHFGAVDYECQVWINNRLVGRHKGGNNPFSFDITGYIKKNGVQYIEIAVTDPTDTESISRGKQQLNQEGIWYTPVSGIWQTVWMEAVDKTHIRQVLPSADIEEKSVKLDFNIAGVKGSETLKIEVLEDGKVVKTVERKVHDNVEINVPNAVLWTPETPKLYHLNITLTDKGRVLDQVKSYFALRKVDTRKDTCGYNRICLNNQPIFQYGPLDQGWWPDGLLTPPSEEAMLWDMVKLKEMGFNMIRKHIKVEPEQYYYYADSLGLMMWQDMVSGFATSRKKEEHVSPAAITDWSASHDHSSQWQSEMFEMIDRLRFYSCITTWVVFNEGWGQHNTVEIVNKVMKYDDSRLINGVTGWTDRGVGAMYDVHNYPVTSMILPTTNGDRISVLGEFGGYGWTIKEHIWNPNMRNWGYKNIDGAMALIDNYGRLVYDLETLIAQGLSAAVYTQTTDVEGEVNGLITYDRKVVKIPEGLLHLMHDRLYRVNPAKAVTLIFDAQEQEGITRAVSLNGQGLKMTSLPMDCPPRSVVVSQTTFDANRDFTHLSLWMRAAGEVKVWLNGVEIFSQEVKQTRQYNQYNISDYSRYLKKGSNELKIEVRDTKKMAFDYGLRAY